MRNHKFTITIAVLAMVAIQQVAQATLVQEASGPAVFTSVPSGTLTVSYDVVYNTSDSLYTYLYAFTPSSGSPIESFSVAAGYVSSVLTTGTAFSGSPFTISGSITSDGAFDASQGTVSWSYDPATSAEQILGFTSYIGPGAGTGSLQADVTGPWGNPNNPLIPAPVPEMSTLISGGLMLLPLGFGVLRSLRKQRTV